MKFRVAGVQTDVSLGQVDQNVSRMRCWLEDPRLKDVDLIVFPECMVTGYCFESFEEAWEFAQQVPGPITDVIQTWCQANRKHVAFGTLERGFQGKLFNSCVLIGPSGIVHCYRKVHLPHLGVDHFTTSGGEEYRVDEIDGLRIGLQICYDGVFPEPSRILSLDGADLLVLPTNWPPGADTFAKFIPNARALENNVYFLAVNRVGIERGFRFIGQSRFCDTNGNTVVEANADEETVLVGEVDCGRARNKQLVRVPGKHVIDRWQDRHPQLYRRISQVGP